MRRTIHALALVLAAAWMPTTLQAAAPPAPPVAAADIAAGKSLFDRWCAECHAWTGYPGTQQLERSRREAGGAGVATGSHGRADPLRGAKRQR
jgi:mono/diheme cytochrome c family protein